MRRICYCAWQGLGDGLRAKGRVVLLWTLVLVTTLASLMSAAIWLESHGASLMATYYRDQSAVAFQLVHPQYRPALPTWPDGEMDLILRDSLRAGGSATSTFAYQGDQRTFPVYVCMGVHTPGSPCNQADGSSGLLIGSRVEGFQIGDTVDLGAHTEPVVERLRAGATMRISTSPWEVPTNLDYSMVFVTDYSHFIDSFDRDDFTWISANSTVIAISLVGLDWDASQIQGFVDAAARDTDFRVLPKYLAEDSGYSTQRHSAMWGAVFAISLIGLAMIGFISTAWHLVSATLRDVGVHRLAGATLADCRIRLGAFVGGAFVLPAMVITSAWAQVPHPSFMALRPYLGAGAAGVLMCAAACVEYGVRHVERRALLLATRNQG